MIAPRLASFAVRRLSYLLSRDYGQRVTVSYYCEEFRAQFTVVFSANLFAKKHNLATRPGAVVCLSHAVVSNLIQEG